MLRGETQNSSGWASSIHNVDTHDILEYLRCAGICFLRLNTSSESFSLAQEDIFLAFEDVGRYPSPIPLRKRPFRGHRTRAFAELPTQSWKDLQNISLGESTCGAMEARI